MSFFLGGPSFRLPQRQTVAKFGGMPRDPKSKWYTTPDTERWRKAIHVTLPVNIIDDLDALAGLGSRAAMVEALIDGEMVRRGLPRAPPPEKKSTPPKKRTSKT